MAKAPPLLFGWLSWLLILISWIVLLGGISASQKYCGRSSAANSLASAGGGSGYLAPVSCDKFYRYTWFVTWYQFAIVIIVPIVLAMGKVHSWRYGLVFLLVPLTYLMMDTCNTMFLLKSQVDTDKAAVQTIFAAAIICSIANFVAIILFGVRDEREHETMHQKSQEVADCSQNTINMAYKKRKSSTLLSAICVCIALLSSVASEGRELLDESNEPQEVIAGLILPPPKCFNERGDLTLDSGQTCQSFRPASQQARISNATTTAAWPTCDKSTVIPPEKIGSCPDAQAALDTHNAARKRYGANPLLWSKFLSDYAQKVSNTCNFQHSNGPYGENLAIGTYLNCRKALDLWVAEESQYPPGGSPGFSPSTGHFTAVVWKATLQVGCAIKSCGGQGNFVTCSYNPPGNVIGKFDSQVGKEGETPECVPPPPGSGTPSPVSSSPVPKRPPSTRSPKPPPPRPPTVRRPPPPPPKVYIPAPPTGGGGVAPPGYCCYYGGYFCYRC